jgi:hypothetical protein
VVNIIFKLLVLLTLTAFLTISPAAFALTKVTASIDNNPVTSNDSIVLTIIADDSMEQNALDTSPLLTNFIIIRTEVSTQTNIVNLSASRSTRWQIVLIPKSTGNLTIPALNIDGHSSQAIDVKVIEQGSANATQQKDIFISTELSSKDIYVQQLITLTIKLHVGVQLQRGSLTEPSLPGATIEQIGKDQESDAIVNGKRYRIIERTYALTPEESGDLILNTPLFSGDIMVQSKRRAGFLSFGETKPVNVLGEKIPLKVRPIPDSFPIDKNKSWLPSELLSLHQEWQPDPKEFKVGEPITRTITLTAVGLGKAQLPEIIMDAPANLKIYPDQADLHSSLTKERLTSYKRQNFAIVASRAGEYILPKITIAWWNTITNKYQEATLPAQTIIVNANPDAPLPLVNPTVNTASVQSENTSNRFQETTGAPIIIEKYSHLQWLFLGLWLFTSLGWIFHVMYLKRTETTNTKNTVKTINNHYLALMAACKKNNADQALNLILPWLNDISLNPSNHEISTLSEAIIQIDNKIFTDAIDELQQYLYGQKSTDASWHGENLLTAIQQINTSGINKYEKDKFTLNPA